MGSRKVNADKMEHTVGHDALEPMRLELIYKKHETCSSERIRAKYGLQKSESRWRKTLANALAPELQQSLIR